MVFTNNLNGPVTVATGNTLTLGSAGIDMSKVNQSVTFNNPITLAAPQVWSITNSRTLAVNGAFTSTGNSVIETGGGTLALGSTTSDAGANIQVNAGIIQANASSGIMVSLNGGTFNVNAADSNPVNVMAGGTGTKRRRQPHLEAAASPAAVRSRSSLRARIHGVETISIIPGPSPCRAAARCA